MTFDFIFITGGICIGKTTVITTKLMCDQELNPNSSRMHAIIEPTEYWYKNTERQMDDTLAFFVFKDTNDNVAEFFPFSEFFIATWLLNIMINMIKASLARKPLLLIERDYSDEYLLQRRPCDSFTDAYKCFECMKKNFGTYMLLRFQTRRPLIDVMRMNLEQRQTSELAILENADYREFIAEYAASYKAIGAHISLASHSKVIVREYFIDRYVSETFDEIKILISNYVKTNAT